MVQFLWRTLPNSPKFWKSLQNKNEMKQMNIVVCLITQAEIISMTLIMCICDFIIHINDTGLVEYILKTKRTTKKSNYV